MPEENKTPEGCLDILGEPMYTNDYVCYSMSDHRTLYIGKIIGWTPKRMKVADLDKNYTPMERSSNLEHHSTRFIKVPKIMVMRLKMGLDLNEVNENTRIE